MTGDVDPDSEIRVYGSNGWKMWETIPAGVRPKYRWQDSWSNDGPRDLIGFDGTKPIGRVFQIESVVNPDLWFWILYGVESAKRERPKSGSGWERSMLSAVCRVEWCYSQLKPAK